MKMIIKIDQKVQINFINGKYLLITPEELGFTHATEFETLFSKIKSKESIKYLHMKFPTVYNPSTIFSLSLPNAPNKPSLREVRENA